MHVTTREKTFGPGPCIPLDRNAKVRIQVYAKAWGARNKQPGQHKGPITRTFFDVLKALLWRFHNARSGACFPSYEAIAARAECCRDTVCQAIKVLEAAGILSWVTRIVRRQVPNRDPVTGRVIQTIRVERTSNGYWFRDPGAGAKMAENRAIEAKSENPSGTLNQDISCLSSAVRAGSAASKEALNRSGGGRPGPQDPIRSVAEQIAAVLGG